MKNFKKLMKDFAKDESAQGMVEYILILVAVIGFVMLVRGKLKDTLNKGLSEVDSGVSGFKVEQ